MRLCEFEDTGVELLEPITLTRPAFDLWCGASSLLHKHQKLFQATETGALIRPYLVDFTRFEHNDLAFNDNDWLRRGPTVFVNARWLPGSLEFSDLTTPRVGLVNQKVAYVIGATGPESFPAKLDDWLESCKKTLPQVQAGGTLLGYLWDIVDQNPAALCNDFSWFQHNGKSPSDLAIVGPREKVVVSAGATIEPYVVADTRQGPVLIDQGAVIQSFSRLEGPCYIGRESWIVGGKLRGGTIGPVCRIGGEVEASLVQGYSNKYHEGFLGHSYIGSWVNLAAGTQTSDLRNDYGMVRAQVGSSRVATGKTKVGSFIGDHTKTGLNALFNTGTVVGAFCNVLPSSSLSPPFIPSFCQMNNGQLQERWDLRQLFQTAAIAMRRRGFELTETHKEFFYMLYDQTADQRHRLLQESEYRRIRRSV